jgi:hypothetical protein
MKYEGKRITVITKVRWHSPFDVVRICKILHKLIFSLAKQTSSMSFHLDISGFR